MKPSELYPYFCKIVEAHGVQILAHCYKFDSTMSAHDNIVRALTDYAGLDKLAEVLEGNPLGSSESLDDFIPLTSPLRKLEGKLYRFSVKIEEIGFIDVFAYEK